MTVKRNTWQREAVRDALDSTEGFVSAQALHSSLHATGSPIGLATGKAAAICGKFLKDQALTQLGQEQLYWIVGKNPFSQSLIYGEGTNYAQQYCPLPGEMVGEIPVGIQTKLNEDLPYWPQANNATYKEVWMTSAGKWLSLVAEYK